MNINLIYGQGAANNAAPSGFYTAVNYVVNYYDSLFTNNVTININVSYGSILDPYTNTYSSLSSGNLGESYENNETPTNYAATKNALLSENAPGANILPSASPDPGSLYMGSAEAKALGFLGASSMLDGSVGILANTAWDYSATTTPTVNQYYLVGMLEHEISEVLGRVSDLGTRQEYTVADLYRYSSPGVRNLTTGGSGSTAYFSIDNGTTNLGSWNNQPSNGDLADWYPQGPGPGGNDACNDYSNSGVINSVSPTDIILMEALGWTSGGTTVSSGQTLNISAGQTSNGIAVLSGGKEYVNSGGATNSTTVSNGGFEVILPGGSVSGSTLNSGGYEYVYSGGVASGTSVSSGAIQNDDGTTSNTNLAGFQIVYSGAIANGTQISSGGYQYILPGGTASGTTVSSGGIQNVDGIATNNTLDGFQVVFSGAVASNTTIDSGGYQYILPGGLANHTTVSHGGIQNDDGAANNTSLGGFQVMFAGATASNTNITSGGYQYILPGATASSTVLSNGAIQNDDGAANGNTISSGGYQIVFSGASASSTTVDAGGFEVVVSGGTTSNATMSGGYIELGGGNGLGNGGTVTFAGGGTLKLDQSIGFTGKIAGFGVPGSIDLADIAFGANTTLGFSEAANNTSGTLTVRDGVHTASLLLLGQYVAGNFHMASDGNLPNAGTLITDPPLTVATDQQTFLGAPRQA